MLRIIMFLILFSSLYAEKNDYLDILETSLEKLNEAYVDSINEDELINLLKFYTPDVRFLGSDYGKGARSEWKKKITGYEVCENIHFINRFHDYSSSGIRKKIYKAEKRKVDLENFKKEEVLVWTFLVLVRILT